MSDTITVSVRTVNNQTSSVDVLPTITIEALRQTITDQCGLGLCSTLVYKGAPLRKADATLLDINYQPGESLVAVFKKVAPGATTTPASTQPTTTPAPVQQQPPASTMSNDPAPVTPVKTNPTPSTTQSQQQQPLAAATTTQAPAVDPMLYQIDWSCPTCTYINIGARTICEMCGSEDPNKAKHKKPSQTKAVIEVDQELVEKRLKAMKGDEMDEETKMAVRAMIEDDIREEMANPQQQGNARMGTMNDLEDGGRHAVTLDELLQMCESNPEQKAHVAKEFGLPADASIDDIRAAIVSQGQQQMGGDDEMGFDRDAILQQLLSDPVMAAQLQTILQEHQGNPEALQQALTDLLTGAMMGDEDDEDGEFDPDIMGDM